MSEQLIDADWTKGEVSVHMQRFFVSLIPKLQGPVMNKTGGSACACDYIASWPLAT